MNRSTSQLSSNKRMQRTRVMDKLVLRLRHRRVADARRYTTRFAAVPLESLTVCQWSDASRSDEVVANPAWGDIEAAIRRLDNRAWNDIYLRPIGAPAETYLAVGGGAGRYVVTGSEAGERFPTLENPRGSETELVPLCVGGQLGEYPSRCVVDLNVALAAVRCFYDAGGFDCGVSWGYQ